MLGAFGWTRGGQPGGLARRLCLAAVETHTMKPWAETEPWIVTGDLLVLGPMPGLVPGGWRPEPEGLVQGWVPMGTPALVRLAWGLVVRACLLCGARGCP